MATPRKKLSEKQRPRGTVNRALERTIRCTLCPDFTMRVDHWNKASVKMYCTICKQPMLLETATIGEAIDASAMHYRGVKGDGATIQKMIDDAASAVEFRHTHGMTLAEYTKKR